VGALLKNGVCGLTRKIYVWSMWYHTYVYGVCGVSGVRPFTPYILHIHTFDEGMRSDGSHLR